MDMSNLFPDKIWNYKNFNMGTKLDIAGEFIYDGIHTLNQMDVIDQDSMLFSFLYHISVGIERMQKIIITLFENVTLENYEEFEKSLITHSHSELSERIGKSTKLQLTSRENDFLQLLAVFYKAARYHRFNIGSQTSKEQKMITDYIKKHLSSDKIQYHFITNKILITDEVKSLFGKVIGSLSKKYYNLIHNGCSQNNTYTYELRGHSKAQKIFLPEHRCNSLQEQKATEMIVLKELIVYLRNTKERNSFIRFLEDIPPLELDIGLLNEHLFELSKGIISQSLMDEVEYLYEENSFSVDRMNLVSLIGNTNILFDYKDIGDCIEMLDSLMNKNYDCKEFAMQFPLKLDLLDDDYTAEILDGVSELCSQFLSENMPHEDFIRGISPYYTGIKNFLKYE